MRNFEEFFFGRPDSPPSSRKLRFSCFARRARNLSQCQRPKMGQSPTKSLFPAGGGLTEKKNCHRGSCGKPSRIAWYLLSISGPFCCGACPGLCGPSLLAACCCLPDAQAPANWPYNWINRLKFYVLQLGDPNPNQEWVLGPS